MIIHADIEDRIDEARAACGADTEVGMAFVWLGHFINFRCETGETKCEKCIEKIALYEYAA